jgi:demethylmenaquinone methyltransferase / 2-methoxy-6-polyprenyl-1,4-benzoquinol methylase
MTQRTDHARRLFAGIAPQYERMGALMSFGADGRWRRFMIQRTGVPPGSLVLDVASGTGLVARELAARRNLRVIQLDPSEQMLRAGLEPIRIAELAGRVKPVLGRAEALPFADETFDALAFTYLLRYVDDPAATLRELARVIRPGGVMSSLEFWRPEQPALRAGWWAYTRGVLPILGAVASPAWVRTGAFLGPSISAWAERAPLATQVRWWQEAGMHHLRSAKLTFGSAVVIWAVKDGG